MPKTKQQWLDSFKSCGRDDIETDRIKVAIIPYDAETGKVLLSVPLGIKKKNDDNSKPQLSFVGGHIEDSDASEAAAALRELKEETHFGGESIKDKLCFIGTYLYKSGKSGKNRFMPVFVLPVSEANIEQGIFTSTDEEHKKYFQGWVSLEHIRQGKTGIDGYDLYQSCIDLFNGENLIALSDNGAVSTINNLIKQTALLCQQNQK